LRSSRQGRWYHAISQINSARVDDSTFYNGSAVYGRPAGVFDRRRLLFSSQGIVAIEDRINFFYQDSANLQIPIMEAYRHVTLELNFAGAKELQNNLSVLRRKYKQ
jgi:hypothetical protein